MLIYFIVLLICFIPEFITEFKSKKGKILIITTVGLFICFGYMVGSDWRAYEEIYYATDLSRPFDNIPSEYGYYLYMLLFRFFNIDFWTFFIFTKIITYLICIYFILKYQTEHFYLSFTLFIFFYGISLFIDNPMRTLLAATIFLFSYRYLENRNLRGYLIITILASMFHIVTIVMIPFYWLTQYNLKTRTIIISFLTINIILWLFDRQLRDIFSIETGIPYLDARLSFYFSEGSSGKIYTENRIISIGLLVRFVFFILLMLSRKKIETKFGIIFFNMVVFSFFLYRLGIGIPIFERLEFYLCIPFSIAMIDILNSLTIKSRPLYKASLFLLISLSTFKNITLDYKYIPYSNYLSYIFQYQKPSFEERSNYNFIHSPYRKKQ